MTLREFLHWPWRRVGRSTCAEHQREEAARARAEAERRLAETLELGPEVREVSARLRRHCRENHFRELIEAAMRRRKEQQ